MSKTSRLIKSMKQETHKVVPIANDMILPNQSGMNAHKEAANFKTHSKIIYIEDPASGDDYPMAFISKDAAVKSVIAVVDTGTIDFNIEKRSKLTPDVAGTDIDSSEFQATTSGTEDTSFSAASISANSWLNYNASAKSGSPTKLWVTITYQLD